ncbi:hypothetical protein KC926_01830 [Candidatus Kaiserbacteria bacterium]|nr:hypothetical protein [Candidatus Kaiserbacteria bacterium]
MIFEGDKNVVDAIKEKKRLIDLGQSNEHVRPLLIQGGGLMCGAYGVGTSLFLEEMGYTSVFSYLVGISSGAPIAAHFAAGTSRYGADVLREDCTDARFINYWRFWHQVNVTYLMDVARNHAERKIDVGQALKNKTKLFFGVADYKTASPLLLRPHDEKSFFEGLHASINLQNISPHTVEVDGVRYVDGGFASPHVITKAIEELSPTHVLIVTNNNKGTTKLPLFERICNQTIFRHRLSGALAKAINRRIDARDEALEKALSGSIPTAVVWGDGTIGRLEKNPNIITSTIETSKVWWQELFQ